MQVDAAGEQREQIVLNLIVNARQALGAHDQGRRLTVSTGLASMTDGDRLNKPFSKAELLVRVAALLTP